MNILQRSPITHPQTRYLWYDIIDVFSTESTTRSLNMKRSGILSISFAVVLAAALFSLLAFWTTKDIGFNAAVSLCNAVETRLRFSCYRSNIERHYRGNLAGFLEKLKTDKKSFKFDSIFKNEKVSYAIFGTNCHTFYHAVGDFIAANTTLKEVDIKEALDYCPSTCTAGCTMGLYKRTALDSSFSIDLLRRFYNICREGERNQCAHEIGHLLQDKYFYSVLKTLDEISERAYDLKPEKRFQYVTTTTTDFNAPFEKCKDIISKNKLAQCYTGVGHNLFLFSEFSPEGYKSMFDECQKIPESNRDTCLSFFIYRIGINDGAAKFLSGKSEEGRRLCDNVIAIAGREDLKRHCYLGIGGGMGLFADSEFSSQEITEQQAPEVRRQLLYLAKLCDESEGDFTEYCLRGLWGTGFKKLYSSLKVSYDKIEQLIQKINAEDDFEVVG